MSNFYEQCLNDPFNYQPSTIDDRYLVCRDGSIHSFRENPSGGRVMPQHYPAKSRVPAVAILRNIVRIPTEVATLFVANPDPHRFTEVLHKNTNKSDNRAENLMWVTPSEKLAWEHDMGMSNRSRVTFIECIETQKTYESIREASDAIGTTRPTVMKYLESGETMRNGLTLREYRGTERVLFWTSDPNTWAKHPKFSNYLVSVDGLVVKLDSDGGLGEPVRTYIRPDGSMWVKTKRKEELNKLVRQTHGVDMVGA